MQMTVLKHINYCIDRLFCLCFQLFAPFIMCVYARARVCVWNSRFLVSLLVTCSQRCKLTCSAGDARGVVYLQLNKINADGKLLRSAAGVRK